MYTIHYQPFEFKLMREQMYEPGIRCWLFCWAFKEICTVFVGKKVSWDQWYFNTSLRGGCVKVSQSKRNDYSQWSVVSQLPLGGSWETTPPWL